MAQNIFNKNNKENIRKKEENRKQASSYYNMKGVEI
jgi:hypothetical protein